jgi:glycyl-tRNA synthetase beta chain
MQKSLLIEIGVEEMPAGWLNNAAVKLNKDICKLLHSSGISYGKSSLFYTPRRIAVLVERVGTKQEDKCIEVTGPPKEVALAKDGAWSQAALGFARAHGIAVEELKIGKKGKNEVVCCAKQIKGTATSAILSSSLPQLISGLEFPKSMHWESSGLTFGRPIRWIVAVLGKTVIPFEIAGVKSGKTSHGLRFYPQIPMTLPDSYESALLANGIVADAKKRKNLIVEQVSKLLAGKKLHLTRSPVEEFLLTPILDEVTNLVECPHALIGTFEKKYLRLPPDVITVAMETHQRYFPLSNQDKTLSHRFAVVVNTKDGDVAEIRRGHEKVLRARLEDADFYYKQDIETPLKTKVDELKSIVWQEGLGTLYEKTERLVKLCKYVTRNCIPPGVLVDAGRLEEATKLSKVDLVTNMIKDGKEFTKLQGLYGSILARKQGVDSKIAEIMEKSSSRVPDLHDCPEAVILRVSDNIDTIVGSFVLGKVPTGSSDPLGIRRAGSSLVRLIVDTKISVPLGELASKTLELYDHDPNAGSAVSGFLIQRFRKYAEEKGIRYDLVDAVLEVRDEDLADLWERVVALDNLKGKEDFITLVMLAKRVRNILKSIKTEIEGSECKKHLLREPEEKTLHTAMVPVEKKFENYLEQGNYRRSLECLLSMAPSINSFFDKVLVMADDVALRHNRLALLQCLHSLFHEVADFSKIAG